MFGVAAGFPDRYKLEIADSVKRILESETAHRYNLETPDRLPRRRNNLWTLSLDDDIIRGFIDSVMLGDGRLWFVSTLALHADFFMQDNYSELSYDRRRDKLGPDFQWLHVPEIRRKHARRIPYVVRYLDKLENLITIANQRWGTRLEMYSGNGEVHVEFEILINEPGDLDIIVLRHMRSLKDVFRRMSRWLDKDDARYRTIYGRYLFAKL
jgi:hypothetical protein